MKKTLILLLGIIPVLTLMSCNDDAPVPGVRDDIEAGKEPVPEVAYWEHSHVEFMGFKGQVETVLEERFSPEEAGTEKSVIADIKFDESGRLLYYDPTGIERTPEAIKKPSTRWIGVDSYFYEYKYDKDGKMTKVAVYEGLEKSIIYTLTYGKHTKYIPLTFDTGTAVGTMDFFLVKGLEKIIGTTVDGVESFNYSFDGNKAFYRTSSWGSEETVTYHYGDGVYPIYSDRITITRGEIVRKVNTIYNFNAKGVLVSTKEVSTEDESDVVTIKNYNPNKFLLITSESVISSAMDEDGNMVSTTATIEYTYNSKDQLETVVRKVNGKEMDDKEEYVYTTTDNQGNWIHCEATQSSIINWMHLDGKFVYDRTITYFQK